MRLGLTISRLAVVVVCNLVIRSSAEPSFDSKFSASDLSTLQQLLLQYSAKLGAADWKGAWSLLAPNAKVTFTNKLLGGSPETASTQAQFVAIYKKASFDGKLVQSLSKATLLSTSPFSVQLDGTISTDKGPLPNTPATFLTKWVFSGNHPGPGQIVFADDQIVSLASSDPTPNAQTSSPSSSSSTSQVPPPPRPNQSPARATSVPGATALSAPVQNSSPARVAPVASAAISAPSALVPAATSGTMQASPSTASIDSSTSHLLYHHSSS
ncbi:hypothetical protein DFH28DRAFT_899758 [Melampsora americana]|nr:hypothetical protein DFH28DRAFT_899758 [Melampsora americana]